MRYFVIGPDGKSYGPAEIPMLQQWVGEGRITGYTQLEVEGTGQRVPASSIPELGFAATAAPSAPADPGAPAAQPPGVSSTPSGPGYAPAGPGFAPAAPSTYSPMGDSNTSGMGSAAAIPPGVGGWNWGAFLLNWIWAIGNKTWIGLLALVPYVGIVMVFVLGVKGSEWAWQNRRFDSVEQFRSVQKAWAWWGLGIFVLQLILAVIYFFVMMAAMSQIQPSTAPPGF